VKPAEFHGFVPQWAPLFWELSEHDAEELLDSGDAWQQTMAVLRAQAADRETFERIYVSAMRQLEPLAGEDHVRWSELMRIILSWGQWRRPGQERQNLLAAARAAQTNVERQKEVGLMAQTIAESIWEEGLRKGELEAARRLLQQLLVKRFSTVPEDVVRRVASATDVERLTAAALQVLDIATPQDLRL
jgi:hypothetical protein